MRPTLKYDPSLDGLRAIAVVSVMVYHGYLGVAGGGFLGVDLFFVLSGYLITTLLLLEYDATGTISLSAFWLRRAKRLLPVMFVVVGVVMLIGALTAGPDALKVIRNDGIATIFYSANWRQAFSEQSYFDQFADPSPFRHMWSLAIEEQWYLVWPLVLAFALPRLFARQVSWVGGLGVAVLLSAGAMAWHAHGAADTSRAYYGTETRVQTLLVGAMLAFLLHRFRTDTGPIESNSPWVKWVGLFGVGGFVAAVFLVRDTDRWMYNGGFLLVALLGAAATAGTVIATERNPLRSMLARRPLPQIGRISYGLYLWHWPIFTWLTESRLGFTGLAQFAVQVTVTVAAAMVSFVVIERPMRRVAWAPRNFVLAGFGSAIAICAALVFVTWPNPVVDERYASALVDLPSVSSPIQPEATIEPTVVPAEHPEPTVIAEPVTPPTAFLIGDSSYLTLFEQYQPWRDEILRVRSGATLGCGLLPDYQTVVYEDCTNRQERWAVELAEIKPDILVLGLSIWDLDPPVVDGDPLVFASSEHRQVLRQGIDEIRSFVDQQSGRSLPVTILLLPCQDPDLDRFARPLTDDEYLRRTAWLNWWAGTYARETQSAVVDIGAQTCEADGVARLNGELLYRDGVHYRDEVADWVWDILLVEIRSSYPNVHGSAE